MNNKKSITIIPKYRFSKYKNAENWELLEFGNVFNFMQTNCFARVHMNNKEGIVRNIHYGDILIKYPTILKNESSIPFLNKDVDLFKFKRNSYVKNGDIIIADTAEDLTAGKAIEVQNINGNILAGLHTFLCRPKFVHSPMFLGYYLNSQTYHNKLKPFLTGLKVYSISKGNIIKTPIARPKDIGEQKKIAECLNSIDELIAGEEDKLKELKNHKKGLLQKLFPKNNSSNPELRFPEFKENWVKTNFEKLLKYERPDKYIVDNTNYNIEGTPVLTANKAFILGYTDENFGIYTKLPVIIFDDFTVDKKYVDFPFKVKSSAIKILKPKFNDNLKFIYELMRTVKFSADEHKRYYISTYQYIDVFVPQQIEEQNKIAECLNSIDELISARTEKIEALKLHKKGLMQGLFPSLEEVKDEY